MNKIIGITILLLLPVISTVFSITATFKEKAQYEGCIKFCKINDIQKPLEYEQEACVMLACVIPLGDFKSYLTDKLNAVKKK